MLRYICLNAYILLNRAQAVNNLKVGFVMRKKMLVSIALVIVLALSVFSPLYATGYSEEAYHEKVIHDEIVFYEHCCHHIYDTDKDATYVGIQPFIICRINNNWCNSVALPGTTIMTSGGPNASFCSYTIATTTRQCLVCFRMYSETSTQSSRSHTWVPLLNAPGHAFCSNCGFEV